MLRGPAAVLVVASILLAGCTGSSGGDADVFPTERQLAGWDVTVRLLDGTTRTEHSTSDPKKIDTDGDGVEDLAEFVEGTHARDVDTDGDGLIDGPTTTLSADSRKAKDWIGAGIVHFLRTGGLAEFPGERTLNSDPRDQDTDRDTLADGTEVAGFTMNFPWGSAVVRTDPFQEDSDDDGLLDGIELFSISSDPSRRDTDGDGAADGADLMPTGNLAVEVRFLGIRLGQGGNVRFGLFASGAVQETLTPVVSGVPSGQWTNASAADVAALDVDDSGGSLALGNWNLTLTVNGYREQAAGRGPLDLGSQTTGGRTNPGLILHVRNGDLQVETVGGGAIPYSAEAGVVGEDGAFRIGLRALDLGIAPPD